MKAVFLAVAAACLAAQGHTVSVKTVGDEASGIFTKIIAETPAGASDAGVYSADEIVDPIFYDAQGRSQFIRRRQQGSYLEQPNRYQIGNRFSASNQNSIRNPGWQKTQAGIKYDNFGRPIRAPVGQPSNIYQDRITAGQSGTTFGNQLGQGSSVFGQRNRVNTFPFESTSGQRNQESLTGQRFSQQIGASRPIIGQQFANQFGSQQMFPQGQILASGQRLSSQQQFGQQFGRPSTGQFSPVGQQSTSQFEQQGSIQFGQPLQSSTGQSAQIPFNLRQVQQVSPNNLVGLQSTKVFGQQSGIGGQQVSSQFGGQTLGQFGQQSELQIGQQISSQFGQQPSGQFGQQPGLLFGQQIGTQFGQQPSGQFGQQSGLPFGQQIGSQFGQQPSVQIGQQSGLPFGQQIASQFGQQPSSQFGQQPGLGQQTGGKFGQQSISQTGQRFIGQQSGFQSGIRSDINQFNRIPNQQPSSLIGNPLRGNDIGAQQIISNNVHRQPDTGSTRSIHGDERSLNSG